VAFDYADQLSDHGEAPIAWADLSNFSFEGRRVPLVSQQGIFKPAALDLPISIRTTYREPGQLRPYEDEVDENGYLLYRYRGTDPGHHENRWLRQVRDRAVPLLYLEGVAKGRYLPSAAAIIEDHPESLTFGVQLMPIDAAAIGAVNAFALDPATRRHYLALVQRRTGQARFRESVLDAYASRCTLCRLRHRELLDAAHIVSYAEGGTHLVTNGMSMCKIHHAAYDLDIVGVRPDGWRRYGPTCWRRWMGRCSSTGCRRCTVPGCTYPGRRRCDGRWRGWSGGTRGFGGGCEGRIDGLKVYSKEA
jgi:putative restriction endonuclease